MTDTAPDVSVVTPPPLVTVPNIELMHTGQWPISTGIANFTTGDLQQAVAALACPAVRRPVLKLGHDEPDPDEHGIRWDGEPAVGYVTNMAVVEGGQTLVGDYAGMPSWLGGEVLASAYPDRSIEGTYDFRCQIGHTHPFVITAVALLGVVPPGIGTLQSLQDVAALYGVTDTGAEQVAAAADPASGPSITVTVHAARQEAAVPNPNPTTVRAGVTTDDVRRAFYSSDYGKSWDIWICEIQLGPDLQIIAIDDSTGKLQRVPITVGDGDGEDAVEFGEPVPVVVRYEDAQVAASAGRQVVAYASRAESRPGQQVRAETVSDTAWSDFTAADYDIDQWKTACLIDTGEGEADSKDRYKVPVREPDGTLNRNGCHAAAGGRGISAVKGISDDVREKAAKKLVSLYKNQLDEDPPESLLTLAGMDESANASAADVRPGSKNTPPPVRAGGTTGKEGAAMDAAKLREALGLSPEASDDEVRAALTEQGVTPTQPDPEPEPGGDPEGQPEGDSGEGDSGEQGEGDPAGEPATQQANAKAGALPPGTVAIDTTTLEQLRRDAKEGVAARAQQRQEARDRALDDAIKAGKFPPARREHWAKYWDRDEEGAKAAIADLAEGLVPVQDAGAPGGELTDEAVNAEFDRLFPDQPKARN